MKKQYQPQWIERPPQPGTYRSIFKYGSPEEFKHPSPRLIALLKQRLNLSEADLAQPQYTGEETVEISSPTPLDHKHIQWFIKTCGAQNVSTIEYDRLKFSTGKTLEEAWMLRQKQIPPITDLVVHPRNKHEIAQITAYCNQHHIPVYVYGGGTSVTLGLTPEKGGVTLVLSTHMNKILEINETNQTVRVQAGMFGPDFEHQLNYAPAYFGTKHSYTCGHFPQSFEYSTVGGWFITLGSGQESSYYGDAADLVLAIEVITPRGTIKTLDYPAAATGPKILDIFKGSEGSFGIITELTWKITRFMPQNRQYFSFLFPSWQAAVEAMREISQGQFGMPAVMRISDPEETNFGFELYGINNTPVDKLAALRGYKPMKRALFIGTATGEKKFARNIKQQVKKICHRYGAMSLSAIPAKRWEHSRYKDPYLREDLMDYGIQIDTLETSVKWDNLHTVHARVRDFVLRHPNVLIMSHSSHFYTSGTNLYFIFLSRKKDLNEYINFHRSIIDIIVDSGGTPSHHHGIGRMMRPWIEKHLGTRQMDVLRCLKNHFDPNNIMNPGVIGLGMDAQNSA